MRIPLTPRRTITVTISTRQPQPSPDYLSGLARGEADYIERRGGVNIHGDRSQWAAGYSDGWARAAGRAAQAITQARLDELHARILAEPAEGTPEAEAEFRAGETQGRADYNAGIDYFDNDDRKTPSPTHQHFLGYRYGWLDERDNYERQGDR